MSKENVVGPYGHDYTSLARRLRSLDPGRIVYVQIPGNAGDAIITTGTLKIFDQIGLTPDIGNIQGTFHDAHVVLAGGGNFIPDYHQTREFIESHINKVKSFTLLPSSVRGHEELLGRLDDRFEIHARECQSYNHLKAHCLGARIRLTDDMAFANRFDDMSGMLASLDSVRMDAFGSKKCFRQLRAYALWRLSRAKRQIDGFRMPSEGKVLNAFRRDKERLGENPLPDGNSDISGLLALNRDQNLFVTAEIAKIFIKTINHFDVVKTDRLHVAIAAAMLGKTVHAGDNSYGKIASVAAHSMRNMTNLHLNDKA